MNKCSFSDERGEIPTQLQSVCAYTQHKKGSNHHANLPLEMYSFTMTRHFDYCPSASEGDNRSVRSSAPVVSKCFPGGYNVKLYISKGSVAWWLLAFLHSGDS